MTVNEGRHAPINNLPSSVQVEHEIVIILIYHTGPTIIFMVLICLTHGVRFPVAWVQSPLEGRRKIFEGIVPGPVRWRRVPFVRVVELPIAGRILIIILLFKDDRCRPFRLASQPSHKFVHFSHGFFCSLIFVEMRKGAEQKTRSKKLFSMSIQPTCETATNTTLVCQLPPTRMKRHLTTWQEAKHSADDTRAGSTVKLFLAKQDTPSSRRKKATPHNRFKDGRPITQESMDVNMLRKLGTVQ